MSYTTGPNRLAQWCQLSRDTMIPMTRSWTSFWWWWDSFLVRKVANFDPYRHLTHLLPVVPLWCLETEMLSSGILRDHINNQVWLPRINDTRFHACSPIIWSTPTTSSISLIWCHFRCHLSWYWYLLFKCDHLWYWKNSWWRGEDCSLYFWFMICIYIDRNRAFEQLYCIVCAMDVFKLHWLLVDSCHDMFLSTHHLWEHL